MNRPKFRRGHLVSVECVLSDRSTQIPASDAMTDHPAAMEAISVCGIAKGTDSRKPIAVPCPPGFAVI